MLFHSTLLVQQHTQNSTNKCLLDQLNSGNSARCVFWYPASPCSWLNINNVMLTMTVDFVHSMPTWSQVVAEKNESKQATSNAIHRCLGRQWGIWGQNHHCLPFAMHQLIGEIIWAHNLFMTPPISNSSNEGGGQSKGSDPFNLHTK